MSHILDALRRADEERHLGRSPDLGAIIQPVRRVAQQPATASRLPWLLLAVAVMLVVALLVWRWPAAPGATNATTEALQAAPIPPTPSAAATAAAQPRAETAPRIRITEAQQLRSFDDVLPPPPPPPPPRATPAPAPQAPAAPIATPAPRAAVDSPPRGGDGLPTLADMPASFRDGFPALQLDVHVYNRDPARRFVLIGGQRYGEGDTLREGPQLEGIEADSLRLQWRGQRLRLPVR